MNIKKKRIALAPAILLVVIVTLLGGCTDTDPASLDIFVTDLLRNAAAAFLL